jgi:large subunit ribosomal protein L25
MSDALLVATPRSESGSRPAGRQRRAGLVPAVVYGLGEPTASVTVDGRELQHILAGGANILITLKIDGADQLALARQVQRHPIRGSLLHVDFVRVRADVEVSAEVPIHLVGDAEGVRNGGVLDQALFTVTVMARPGDIPTAIDLDVTDLDLGGQLRIDALRPPAGVTIQNDPDEVVASVSAPAAEVAAPVEGEEVEGAAPEGAPAAAEGAEEPEGE